MPGAEPHFLHQTAVLGFPDRPAAKLAGLADRFRLLTIHLNNNSEASAPAESTAEPLSSGRLRLKIYPLTVIFLGLTVIFLGLTVVFLGLTLVGVELRLL